LKTIPQKYNFLVTGGAGFIGSHIVEELIEQGQYVRVIDNFITGKKENLQDFISGIELIEGDLRDSEQVKSAVRDIDYVIHQAALPSVPRSVSKPLLSNECNINGTLNLLVASKDAGVKRFVYASSSSVYGDTPVLPKEEGMKTNPLSPYAVSKLAGEHYCRVFSNIYGFETVSLRYFNVFGPRQDPKSQYAAVIPLFVSKIFGDEAITIHGDGEQTRDFSYVKNVVNANLQACFSKKDVSGKVFNIACGKRISINRLVLILKELTNRNIKAINIEPRPGDVKHSLADINMAKEFLDYEPEISVERGLEIYIEWFKKQM